MYISRKMLFYFSLFNLPSILNPMMDLNDIDERL